MNDRIAAIRERCEAIQIITPNQARKDLIQAKKDMTYLLTELTSMTAHAYSDKCPYEGCDGREVLVEKKRESPYRKVIQMVRKDGTK